MSLMKLDISPLSITEQICLNMMDSYELWLSMNVELTLCSCKAFAAWRWGNQNSLYPRLSVSAPVFSVSVLITNGPHKQHQSKSYNKCRPEHFKPIKPNSKTSIKSNSITNSTYPYDDSSNDCFNPHVFQSRQGLGLMPLNMKNICNSFKLDHLTIIRSQTDPDILFLTETWLKDRTHASEMSNMTLISSE